MSDMPFSIEGLLDRPRNRRPVSLAPTVMVGAWEADIPGTLLTAVTIAVCTRCDLDGPLELAQRAHTTVIAVITQEGLTVAERVVWQIAQGLPALVTPDEETGILAFLAPTHTLRTVIPVTLPN